MGNVENIELVRRGYEAFNSGDLTTLGGMFTDDAVWHVAGRNELSGPRNGRDAILSFFGDLGARTQGSFRAHLEDILGGDNYTVALHQTQGTGGGKSLDVATVITFAIRDGKVTEAREYSEDSGKLDDFWA